MPTDPDSILTPPQVAWAVPAASDFRYRRVFEAARDGILILDDESGKIIDVNPFMVELLGYEYSELLGKELWEIGLFGDQAANQGAYERLRSTGLFRHEHLPLRAKDGREVDIEFISNRYCEGETSVIQCNIRDITERRRVDVQVRLQAENLAESNDRKDEFLAILSHELRNPLASILNAVQIFQLRPETDPVQAKAQAIVERQVGQLILLIDDLLETTRISTGVVTLHRERCEAGSIIRRAIEGLAHSITESHHSLTVMIPSRPIWINADPGRIEQVVSNLLVNAVKYTDPGGRIEVTVVQAGAEMVLKVKDSGIGIAPGLLPKVFELFTQADRSLVRSKGGLGIGLTIVNRLVKLHGGTVEALSSGLGCGSEFIVRLPTDGTSSPEEQVESNLVARRVLVVDDNVDYADGIAVLLRTVGYHVEVVYSGPDALHAALKFRPDVVVLDIGLPGMDGYEVASRIRQDPALSGLWIVGVSGYRQETEGTLSREAQFDGYLMKPVRLATLEASFRP